MGDLQRVYSVNLIDDQIDSTMQLTNIHFVLTDELSPHDS